MKFQANKYGEIDVTNDSIVYSMPVNRFKTEDRERLEERYRIQLERLEYSEYFSFANSITELRAHFLFSYELKDCVNFLSIRGLMYEDKVPLLKSLVQIAKLSEEKQTKILWDTNNFFINMGERTIQALLFEFEGMTIFSHKKPIDGLKELIILSLTTLNHVMIKKPSKMDFIEKRDEVYQFMEDILQAKSIADIEQVVDHALTVIELEVEKQLEQLQAKKQKSLFGKLKSKKKSTHLSIDMSLSDKLKRDLAEKNKKGNAKKFKEKKSFLDKLTSPIGVSILIPVIAALTFIYFITDGFSNFGVKDQTAIAKEQSQFKIKEIYRTYLSGDKEKAYAELDSIGYNNLSSDDQEMLIQWYLEQKKYIKALSTDEKSAFAIGDTLIQSDNVYDLEELVDQTDNKILKFDLGSVESDYETVIANKDIAQFNERRAYALVEAFYLTNNEDDLDIFIDQMESKKDNDTSQTNAEILNTARSMISAYYEQMKNIDHQIDQINKEIHDGTDKKEDEKKEVIKNLEQQRANVVEQIKNLGKS
jgi:hypothetical protein